MSNDIDIDTAEYNRRMDTLDEETKQMEREQQQREVMDLIEQMEPPKMFHMQVAFPTRYLLDDDGVSLAQTIALGDAVPLFEILEKFGLHIMYGQCLRSPKVTNIIIGSEWSEATVEWGLI